MVMVVFVMVVLWKGLKGGAGEDGRPGLKVWIELFVVWEGCIVECL